MDEENRDHLEDRRQLEHLIPVGFAFLLPYISYGVALSLACLAVLHALYISPRLVQITTRKEEKIRGFSMGKLLYAVSILILLLIFPNRLYIVAGVWALLAVGDSVSNIIGRRWGSRRLPYNPEKSFTGFVAFWGAGTVAAWVLVRWNLPPEIEDSPGPILLFCSVAALLTAFSESLPFALDDNFTISWVGSLAFVLLFAIPDLTPQPVGSWTAALIVNSFAALLATFFRWISVKGTLLAFFFGLFVFISMGWHAYLVLCVFLFLGSIATRLGRQRKEDLKVAQGRTGRRGLSNVLCNGAIPFLIASFSLWIRSPTLAVAFAGAVATATLDTVATEIGQWLGKRPVSPLTLRQVRVGTPGGISLEGTIAGLLAATLVAATCSLTGWLPLTAIPVIILGALAGGLAESLIASTLKRRPPHSGSILNIYNTLMGAFASGVLWTSI